MILLAALLQAAEPKSALEAERAYAADAQAIGEFAAMERWAAEDGEVFLFRETVPARGAARRLAEAGERERTLRWQADVTIESCDGSTVVTSGPEIDTAAITANRFHTVWTRGEDGWRYALRMTIDSADPFEAPEPAKLVCENLPGRAERHAYDTDAGRGAIASSADGSLKWEWRIGEDEAAGGVWTRGFRLWGWNGADYAPLLDTRFPIVRSSEPNRAQEPQSALEAEYAFAKDAHNFGQWSAFRKWAATNAMAFDPWPVPIADYLGDRPDPERAMDWWPVISLVACDGNEAFNMGHWRHPGGAVGYFVTHWVRGDDGWRYRLDGGAGLPALPDRAEPVVVRPECEGSVGPLAPVFSSDGRPHDRAVSADGSIVYEYMLDRASGGFYAKLRRWNGTTHEEIWKERPE